jgi:hypothetical protein
VTAANRALWTVIGLVLLALGVVGVLVNLGHLPGTYRNAHLLWPELLGHWRSWGNRATAGVIIGGLLLAALGALLLRVQLLPRGRAPMPDLVLDFDSAADSTGVTEPAGRTRVRTSVLADGLARDVGNHHGVVRASADIAGDRFKPELLLRLTVDPGVNLDGLRRHVDASVRRFATTTDLKPVRVEVSTRVTDRAPQRVH